MRAPTTLAICLIFSLALAACSGIETRPSDSTEFSAGNYRYYSWRSEPMVNTINSTDPIYRVDPVFRQELDAALRAKGYVLSPERAQFSVDYIYGEGLRMGETSRNASNLSTHPGVVANRNMDQASVDNAYALGGVKETANIGIQLNDVSRNEEVWRVIITKIIDDVNSTDTSKIQSNLQRAIKEGLKELPPAS